jgi:PAS domain S-box-containing protein
MSDIVPRPLRNVDPVLFGMGLLGLAVLPWFLLGDGGNRASWALQATLDLGMVVMALRLARLTAGERYSRRFWRAMAVATGLCVVGDGYQSLLVFADPARTNVSLVQTALVVSGMTLMVVVMLIHPLGRAGRQRLRLWLDAATVLVAVAVFLWYFSLGSQLADGNWADRYAAAASSAAMLVVTFGVLKLVFSGTAPFSLLAGTLGSIGVAGSAVGTSVALVLTGGSHPRVMIVVSLLPCVLVVFAMRLQEVRTRRHRSERLESRRRPFSRLPYLAVVSTQSLLVVALLGSDPDARIWGLTIGAVLITGLVLTRQLAAFFDNDRLLTSLDDQQEWFLALARHASDVTLVSDGYGWIRYASPAVARVLGVEPEAAVGQSLPDHVHTDDMPEFVALGTRLAATPGTDASAQLRLRHTDGSYRWFGVVGVDLRANPSVRGIVYNARDITEQYELQEELRHQATHDGLTGLANRALLNERLAATLGEVSVLVIDLNDFKQVNDAYGHHVGDELLVTVARRLTETIGPNDLAARLGGDELALVLA